MKDKIASTSVPVHDIIARRWSSRAIDPAKPVAEEELLSLLEAARWAPSCFGDQPWRFVIYNRFVNEQSWQAAYDCLMEGNQAWAQHAPILILVAANTRFTVMDHENRWGEYDTGAAAENLALQATELNLVVRQMGGFEMEQAREVCGVPSDFNLMAFIAVGHALPADQLSDELAAQESESRSRHPLGSLFFDQEWGKAYSDSS